MYDVTFKNVANFTAPTAVIQLRLDAAKTLDAAYTKLFTIGANINIPEGQWKLTTESTWLNGTDTITKPAGTYDVEFKSVKHYQPVATVQYVLDEATSQNDTPYIADGNYVEYPQYNVTVTTNEAGGQ